MDNGHKTGPSIEANGDTKTMAVGESSQQQPPKRKYATNVIDRYAGTYMTPPDHIKRSTLIVIYLEHEGYNQSAMYCSFSLFSSDTFTRLLDGIHTNYCKQFF